MAALQDMLAVADASDTTSFVQTLVAVDAFINKLFSKYIKLQTGGSIRGGDRYDASGNLVDGNVSGFWFGSNGVLKLAHQTVEPSGIDTGSFVVLYKTASIHAQTLAEFAPSVSFACNSNGQVNMEVKLLMHYRIKTFGNDPTEWFRLYKNDTLIGSYPRGNYGGWIGGGFSTVLSFAKGDWYEVRVNNSMTVSVTVKATASVSSPFVLLI